MKKIIFVLAIMMTTALCAEGHNRYDRHMTLAVRTFYDDLSPYGEWIDTPDYGYAWRPYLDDQDDFKPYGSRGNWAYTDLGWTWVSDYRWGWAAFHYGRWYFDDYLGWMWIPGNEWAPAWVTWGSYNDLWAWAPMGPNIQVSIHAGWRAPHSWWTFVPRQHFCSGNWHAYIYRQPVQVTNITYITNVYYDNNDRHPGHWFHGPRVRDVERHLHKRVQRMQLVDTDRPDNLVARNNRVAVYRPGVTNDRSSVSPARTRSVESTSPKPRVTKESQRVKTDLRELVKSSNRTYQKRTSSSTMDRTRNTEKNRNNIDLTGNRASVKSSTGSRTTQPSSTSTRKERQN